MNFRTTYILFGLLGVLLVLFVVAVWMGPKKDQDLYLLSSAHDEKNPVQADDIVSVTVERTHPSETLVFQREDKGGEWKMTGPLDSRVEDSTVSSLVRQVLDAKKDAGMEPPAAVVTLKSQDGREWKLNLGNEIRAEQSGVIYVTSSDHSSPAEVVKYNQLDVPFKPVNDFRSKDLLAGYAVEIKDVKLRDGTHDPIELRESSPNTWRFVQPDLGDAEYNGTDAPLTAKPPKGVSELLEAVAGLKVRYKDATDNDFVEDSDLAKYGLGKDVKDRLEIQVSWTPTGKTKSKTDTLLIGKPDDKDKGEKFYARLESEKNVVKVSAASLQMFRNLLGDTQVRENLRDHVLARFDPQKIDAIDLEGRDGKPFRLRRAEGKGPFEPAIWKLYREGSPPQNADSAAVNDLLSTLRPTNPQTQKEKNLIQGFLDDKEAKKDAEKDDKKDDKLVTITLWENSIQKEEPKKDDKEAKKDSKKDAEKDDAKKEKKETEPKLKADAKPVYKLTFFTDPKAAANQAIAVRREREGKPLPPVMVPNSLVEKVTAGPLAYRDKSLPKFEGDVTKVVLNRGKEDLWELKQEKKDGKTTWKIEQPKARAGQTADSSAVTKVIDDLRFLRAEKLLEEKATPDLEKKYGLDKPKVKVTLTVGKSEEHTYLFGDDAEAGSVYAKLGEEAPLFTVRKDIVTDIQGDLRDKALFHFTPDKVKEMKLTGWYDFASALLGEPYTLVLERKGVRDWKLKEASTKTFKQVDVNKAEEFVKSLADLQVKQFLAPKTGEKDHKLELKENALKIEITVEGEKEPYTLTLGGPTSDNQSFYATSNRLPGEVFLLPSYPFEKVKNKGADKDSGTPFYFKKE